jgi:hyperosmotically inducible protein
MNPSKTLLSLALSVLVTGAACSPKEKDEARDAVQQIEDKTKEVVADTAEKGKEIISSTGEAINDGWITTKIKAKFADDTALKESDIDIDTKDRVVTLKGTVSSSETKKRAAAIATGTEGVLRVVDQLSVKSK